MKAIIQGDGQSSLTVTAQGITIWLPFQVFDDTWASLKASLVTAIGQRRFIPFTPRVMTERALNALAVLKILARGDAEMAAHIAEIARAHLRGVDLEEVAFILYDDLTLLKPKEVWDRAGSTRHGYVDPTDAAYEMIEDVLDPYREDLQKYQKLGMSDEANQICMGLLLGFYRFEHESDAEFKDWAPDAMSVFPATVVEAWREGNPSRADVKTVQTFIDEQLRGWGPRLD